MKRIHFTDEDLRNVRVGATYGPLAEAAFSLEHLVRSEWPPVAGDGPDGWGGTIGFAGWRERVAGRLHPEERALARLVPRGIDLVTMTGPAPTIEEGLEAVAAAPAWVFREEMAASVPGPFRPPAWAAPLADRAPAARRQLATALAAYHAEAVAPYWPAAERLLEAERERAVHLLGERGVDHFLATRHPTIRWGPPVLTIDTCLPLPDQDAWLDGRGVVFVPSIFCPPGYPMCSPAADPDASPVIHYPMTLSAAERRDLWASADGSPSPSASASAAVAALLGRTRAAVLDAVACGPCSTSELAQRAAVSLATASEHAAVLRRAGLVSTRRKGRSVLHTLTARGAALLDPHT